MHVEQRALVLEVVHADAEDDHLRRVLAEDVLVHLLDADRGVGAALGEVRVVEAHLDLPDERGEAAEDGEAHLQSRGNQEVIEGPSRGNQQAIER